LKNGIAAFIIFHIHVHHVLRFVFCRWMQAPARRSSVQPSRSPVPRGCPPNRPGLWGSPANGWTTSGARPDNGREKRNGTQRLNKPDDALLQRHKIDRPKSTDAVLQELADALSGCSIEVEAGTKGVGRVNSVSRCILAVTTPGHNKSIINGACPVPVPFDSPDNFGCPESVTILLALSF
jgi:hypothetical protein